MIWQKMKHDFIIICNGKIKKRNYIAEAVARAKRELMLQDETMFKVLWLDDLGNKDGA